ncbi:MAG: OmpH family outer membrane protein [Chlorobiaceae bacterium]
MNYSGRIIAVSSGMVTAIALGMLLVSPPVFSAQGAERVGIVDSGKILRLMPETRQAETTLQATATPLRKELDRMGLDLKNSIASYEQQKGSLAKAIRAQKEKELSLKAQNIQKYQQVNSSVLEKKKQALFLPIRQKIQNAIMSIAQKNGFSVVLEKGAALYVTPDHDLTLQVMTQLHIK